MSAPRESKGKRRQAAAQQISPLPLDVTSEQQRHAAFRRLINNISTEFVGLAASDIDQGISRTLGAVGAHAGADRVYVFQIRDQGRIADNTHEWCKQGIDPHKDSLQGMVMTEELPWFTPRIQKQDVMHIPDVGLLPREAHAERALFQAQGIRSLVVVPMIAGDALLGFVGFDAVSSKRAWSDDDLALLRIVGATFGNALQRKHAEEELRTSKRRLEDILRGTNVGSWEWNIQTGETIFNERWAEIIGYSLDELAPLSIETWTSHCHPQDLQRSEALLQKHFRGELEYYECEARMRHKNGEWVWVLDRGQVSVWRDGQPLLMSGTHQDITARKNMEMQLQLANLWLEATFQALDEAVFVATSDRRLVRVNAAAERIFGYNAHDLLNLSTEVLHVDRNHYEEFGQRIKAAFERGEAAHFEFQVRRRNGEIFPSEHTVSLLRDTDGELLGILSVVRDITLRKRAEQALIDKERFISGILDSLPSLVAVLDQDGKVVQANAAWKDFAALHHADDTANCLGVIHLGSCEIYRSGQCQQASKVVEGIREVITGTRSSFHMDYRCPAPDRQQWFMLRAQRFEGERETRVVISHDDITDIKTAELKVMESEERFRQLVENINEAFWIKDLGENRIIYASTAFQSVWGLSPARLYDDSGCILSVTMQQDYERVAAGLAQAEAGDPIEEQFRIYGPEGEIRWVRMRVFPVQHADGAVYRLAGVAEDITRQKEMEDQLLLLATTDSLTGIMNRRHFLEQAEVEFSRCRRYTCNMCVLMMDIDHFKYVNDTQGHHAGDILLKAVVERTRRDLRPSDLLGRMGGEEFAIVLVETGDREGNTVAQRLRASIEAMSVDLESTSLSCTVSIGCAHYSDGVRSLEDLLRLADQRMYAAKQAGRNTVVAS